MRDLIFYHDDNGIFKDHTKESRDFLRDDFTIDFVNAEDYIYFGLYKPFNKTYVEFLTPSVVDVNLSAEYYNGTTWESVKLNDDTKGFQRSGFISLDKPEDWSMATINSEDKYYIRLKCDDFTADFRGFNIVFSDDNDLQQEVRCIYDFLLGDDVSFIAYHVGTRNEIIQTFRNGGYSTKKKSSVNVENFTKWDLLDLGEIRQAAKYLTLSKIFFDASENTDDKHYQKSLDYRSMFGEAFKLYRLSIDKDDDGIVDDEEKTQTRNITVMKL